MSANPSRVVPAHVRRALVAAIALVCIAAPSDGRAQDAVTRARAFIAQAQLGSDRFAGAPLVDAVEAIRAMTPSPQRDAAVVALYLALPEDGQALFARLGALALSPYGDLAGVQVAEERLRAGTLGLGPEHGPADPLVVLEALRFAARGTSVVGASERLVTILQNFQHGDGSFGFVDNDGDLALTAEVVRTLREQQLGPVASMITGQARTWLVSRASALRGELPAADLALLLLAIDGADPVLVQALVQELAARQEPAGGFDGGDLRGTALAIEGLGRGLPDLRVARPSVDLADAVTGESLTKAVLVSNVGLTESPVTRIDFRLLAGGAVRLTGSVPVQAIAAGRSVSVAIPLGVQGTPADAVLEVIANPAGDFGEGELDQNVLAIPFRIQDLPDLVITPADIAVVPTPPVIHEANRVTIRVSNVGEAMARNVAVQLFDGDPAAGGALVRQIFLNAVAVGTPRTFTADYVPRATTATQLYARVDPGGTIRERSESNNVASIDVKPENPAEFYVDLRAEGRLTVTNGEVPTSFAQGEPASVTYWIGGWIRRFTNPSPYDSLWPFSGVNVVVYDAAPGGATIELDRRVVYPFVRCNLGGPAPYCGDVYSALVDVPLPRDAGPGTHRVTVVVDPGHLVPDRDPSNNVASIDVRITNPGSPELFIESMIADRYSVASTRPSTIHASVINSGVAAAVAVPYSITFPTRVVQGSIPYLAPGDRFAIDQQVVFEDLKPDYPYQYAVTLRVDPDGVVSESTKTNNSASIVMSQGIGDFRIDAISQPVRPAPAGVATTPLDVTVYNDTTESTAWMKISAGGVSVNDFVPLEPSGSRVVTFGVPTKGLKGPQTLTATVTAQSAAGHWSGAERTFLLDVGNADFSVAGTAIALDPELPASGQPVTATVLVSNLGNVGAETSVRLYRGYPEQGELVSSGRVYVGAGAASSFVGVPFVPPQEAPYVITAVVDEEDAWTELDEKFNNRAVRNTLKAPGQIQVVFDEIHGPGSTIGDNPDNHLGGYPGNLGEFARVLIARGYDVKAIGPDAGALGPAHLRGVDVLLTFAPVRVYDGAELRLLRDYVERGGGFFYLGEHREPPGPWAWGAPEDQIASTFGFVSNHDFLNGREIPCSVVFQGFTRSDGNIRDHVITTGVDSIIMAWGGSFGDVLPPGAEVLIRSPATWPDSPNTVVSAVFPIGQGRMGIIGDANVFDVDSTPPSTCGMGIPYYSGSNSRFGLQMVDWLAKGGLRDWKPDLAFIPSRLELSKSVIDAGDLVTVVTTIRNIGGALGDAGETTVRLYDGDPATGRVIADVVVPPLGVDQGHRIAFTWDTSRASGHHVLTAVVDPENRVDEFAEDNNEISVQVDVRRDVDLRVDPSDIVVTPGEPPQVSVRIHNIGYTAVPPGARVDVLRAPTDGIAAHVTTALAPAIGGRSAVTLTIPWVGTFPVERFDLKVKATVPAGEFDADPATNEAARRFEPPELGVHAPLAGTQWGGRKSVRFSAASVTRGAVTCSVSIAPAGGAFAEIAGTTCDVRDLDTSTYANGAYVVRVVAHDGLQATVRDVPIRIANDVLAVRTFGAAPGAATATMTPPSGTSSILVPVGARVTSATLVAAPAPTRTRTVRATPTWDYEGSPLVRYRGALHLFQAASQVLTTQISYDEGVTWTAETQLATGVIVKAAAVNGAGLHLAYSTSAGLWYTRSDDGILWSDPVQVSASGVLSLFLRATEEQVVLFSTNPAVSLAIAETDGSNWGPFIRIAWQCDFTEAAVRGGKLHVVYYAGPTTGTLYRNVPVDRYVDLSAYTAPVQVVEPGASIPGALITRDEIVVARLIYLDSYSVQRCRLDRGCEGRDAWQPEPTSIAPQRMYEAGALWLAEVDRGTVKVLKQGPAIVNGVDGGQAWSAPVSLGSTWPGVLPLVEKNTVQMVSSASVLWRWPGLSPTDVSLDVGGDGGFELASSGMLNDPVQSTDLAASLDAYIGAHADGDDGKVDGFIAVPLAFAGGGAGEVMLADLEVVYSPGTSVAGFAAPPVFSPTASPGVLDTSTLSLLSGGSIAVQDGAGTPVRVLATSQTGGRSVAVFDGRDASGTALPSGRYPFGGSGGAPVAEVEIDDVPPTAVLRSGSDGSYGGVAPIYGVATDGDWAGTSKNFARYVLEYTRDGSTWTRIATSTSPVDGLLGSWDTRRLSAGPVTVRLTAYDRAGNTATTSRVFGVSPLAPLAPVIDAPTVPGKPVDSATPKVSVAGTAEPGATVTVFVDGVAVGTAASDGRWVLADVTLPERASEITASATRKGLTGPLSQPIVVARYSLVVSLELPTVVHGAAVATGTVTVTRTSVNPGALSVRLSATDSLGSEADIGLAPVARPVTLPPAGTTSFAVQLGGPSVRAGTYIVRADVDGGLIPANAQQGVRVEPATVLFGSLVSDKATYGQEQVVSLSGRLVNGASAATGPLDATITVNAPSGSSPVVLGPFALEALPAWASRAFGALYGNPPLAVGTYVAELSVTDASGAVVATASTTFAVRASSATSVSGTLLVSPPSYSVGDTLAAGWTVTNQGPDATLSVAVLLVRASDGFVYSRHDEEVAAVTGAKVIGTAVLSTALADGGELTAVLLANDRGLAAQTIQWLPTQDGTPPVISIDGFVDGEYRNKAVTPVITVTDSSPVSWGATLSGTPFTSGTAVVFDGDYVVSVAAVDAWGNKAAQSKRFTIDTVAPVIDITGIEDGALVSAAVSPIIRVSDVHPGTQTIRLDALPWDGLPVSGDGEHLLEVTADDLAGNHTEVALRFSIDTTRPILDVLGVSDGGAYRVPVQPLPVVSDAHPSTPPWTAALNGAPWTGDVVSIDGDWTLVVSATDAAGNAADPLETRFIVDTVPPTITFGGVLDGVLVRTIVTPVVQVADPHPKLQTVVLDGAPWDGQPVTADGHHVLEVHAEDLAGNLSDARLQFTIDRTPPVLEVSGVDDGGLYGAAVRPVPSVTDANPASPAWTGVLDGAAWAGDAVSAEGDRVLVLNAVDLAGNAGGPVAVRFAIDTAAPTIMIAGITNGQLTRVPVSPIIGVADPHLASSAATLDGAVYASGTAITAEGDHRLVVSAADRLGHTASARVDFAIDTTPPAITIAGVVDGATYDGQATPTFAVTDTHPGSTAATLDGASFTSGTSVTSDGAHTLVASGTDAAGNTASKTVTFRVNAVRATLAASVDKSARVLVVVNCAGQPETCRDQKGRVLYTALAGAGIPFDVALDPTTFLAMVRQNRHNVRILYRNSSSATNAYAELRELTYEGGGLITVNDASPDNDPKLKETIGVGMGGSIKCLSTLSIAAGDLGPARSFSITGSGIAQSVLSSTVKVVGTASKSNIVTTNRYGHGRAVTLTFNPEQNDTANVRDLLVQSVRFAAAGTLPAGVPGAPQYVSFTSTLTSPAGPVSVELDAWTASSLVPLSDAGIPTTSPRTWAFSLTSATPDRRSLGVAAGQPGTYPVLGELAAVSSGGLALLAQASVDVTVTGSIAQLKADAITATAALPTSSARTSALAALNAVNTSPTTKAACDTSISNAISASESLKSISGSDDARVKTDRLLRALQVLYATLP